MFSFLSKNKNSPMKLSVPELKDRIRAVVDNTLLPLGFVRYKKEDVWMRARNQIAHDKVFVNFIHKFSSEMIIASVHVGIHCPPLYVLLGRVFNYKYSPTRTTTGEGIGTLTPRRNYLEWQFRRDQEPEANVRGMMDIVITYGIPFMESISGLDSIVINKKQRALRFTTKLDLAGLEYLSGRSDDAKRTLQEALACEDAPDEEKPKAQIPSKKKAWKLAEVFETDAARESILVEISRRGLKCQ